MMTDDEKESLRLAGIMADTALDLVGCNGLNFHCTPANLLNVSDIAMSLRKAVENYNTQIIKLAQNQK